MQYDHDLLTYNVAEVGFAGIAAFTLGLIAHHNFRFYRRKIRVFSLVIVTLMALPTVIDALRATDRWLPRAYGHPNSNW